MDLSNVNIAELVPELEKKRAAMGMSYQNVADSCNVSERTIRRFFQLDWKTSPQVELVRAIIAALHYEYVQAPIAPANMDSGDYADYLKSVIAFEREDKRIRLEQQTALHNRQQRENRRIIVVIGAILGTLVLFICALFLYDFAHLDRGWIQSAYTVPTFAGNIFAAVTHWFAGWI